MDDSNAKILIADDEERIRMLLKLYLEKEGYITDEAEDGEEALTKALSNDYDCILLDIMMPIIDGVEVCTQLRKEKPSPIIMITAKGEEANRVEGLEAGADDYIVKPFSPREAVLRVKALLRRSNNNTAFPSVQARDVVIFPNLTIDNEAHRVIADKKEVHLTPKEYDLLFFLAKHPDKVFEREELLREVWKYEYFGDLRTVDTHVKRLREKVSEVSPEVAKMISTVWGIGYKFNSLKEQ